MAMISAVDGQDDSRDGQLGPLAHCVAKLSKLTVGRRREARGFDISCR